MLVIGDYKHLEWDTCVYGSQDKIAIEELFDPDKDMHTDNQNRFGLPDRLIAKKFLFRLIFGGTAYAYAGDWEFKWVSDKAKFWQEVIDAFYLKYQGVRYWHERLVLEAMETGKVTIATGRSYSFTPYLKRGELVWPRTTILNYPVQGLGADLMVIARVLMKKAIQERELESKIISTVHDSILLDGPEEEVPIVAKTFHEVWSAIPEEFENRFGVAYNLPCRVEVKYGPNWKDMKTEDKLNAS